MLFDVNVVESWLHEVALVLNYKHGRLPFLYLGCPISYKDSIFESFD